jgi:penicillin-insensitive murein DD-endopeptidase
MRASLIGLVLAFTAQACAAPALAQDKGTLEDRPLPPLANPADPRLPAKEVFGRALTPIEAKTRSIGYYWRGCLAGARRCPWTASPGRWCGSRATGCGAIQR